MPLATKAGLWPPADTWPLWRRDPANTGCAPVTLKLPPRLLWRRKLAVPFPSNAVLLADAETVWAASGGRHRAGDLYAFQARSGRPVWSRKGGVTAGCLVGDTLVLALRPPGDDRDSGVLIGLQPRTGAQRWRTTLPGTGTQGLPADYCRVSFTTDGRFVYANAASRVAALEPRTGRIRHRVSLDDGKFGRAPDLAVGGSSLFLTRFLDYVVNGAYTFETRQLSVPALQEAASLPYSLPVPFAGLHVVGMGLEDHGTAVLRGEGSASVEARQLWHSEQPTVAVGYRGSQPLLLQLFTPLAMPRRPLSVVARRADTQQDIWRRTPFPVPNALGAATRNAFLLPAAGQGRRPRGGLYALDLRTGNVRWKYERPGLRLSSPAIAGGRVFTLGNDGHLYAFGQ